MRTCARPISAAGVIATDGAHHCCLRSKSSTSAMAAPTRSRTFRCPSAADELVTVLGANGAGKTSLLRALQGLVPAAGGKIRFDGQDISALSPPQRLRRHLALVPEGRQIVLGLSVHENLQMGDLLPDRRRGRAGYRRHLRPLSKPRGAAEDAGFGALGRRAANAGNRPRAAGKAQADDA